MALRVLNRDQTHFLLLNIGHFLDHLFMLVFATVAALVLSRDWGISYGALIAYATPGFFAFGLFALPAGWLADKWTRDGMMAVFFVGVGLAAIATGFADTPVEMGVGLFVVGIFAAIYHPVGLAIVTAKWKNTGMRIAMNGVWGNLGVAFAAFLTGYMIDHGGWRWAFWVPGALSIGLGVIYAVIFWPEITAPSERKTAAKGAPLPADYRAILIRISAIVFLTTAVSSIIFQSTTFALPKILDERLTGLASDVVTFLRASGMPSADLATIVGSLALVVFSVASMAQLVVGASLDRFGPRQVFAVVAVMQLVFFAAMPGLTDGLALAVALGFMLGAFGQIPINDFMIGKMAAGPARARIYGVRYVVSFTVLAVTLPLIAVVYERWGFDMLFLILAAAALVILCAVLMLPKRLPAPPVPA
ncbi:MAG: MFS transporter [Pseudomonadota bacterium]